MSKSRPTKKFADEIKATPVEYCLGHSIHIEHKTLRSNVSKAFYVKVINRGKDKPGWTIDLAGERLGKNGKWVWPSSLSTQRGQDLIDLTHFESIEKALEFYKKWLME